MWWSIALTLFNTFLSTIVYKVDAGDILAEFLVSSPSTFCATVQKQSEITDELFLLKPGYWQGSMHIKKLGSDNSRIH